MQPTKAISVQSPWWWYILHGGKDIENRSWWTDFRGVVYLHASKWWGRDQIAYDTKYVQRAHGVRPTKEQFEQMRAACGALVGTVEIVDCVREGGTQSSWFEGKYGFVLANPVAFRVPVPYPGQLRFFTLPKEVLAQLAVPDVE